MNIDNVDPNFSGLAPSDFCRNGLPANGPFARAVARGANHLLARNGAIIPGKSVLPGSARSTASELALWRTRYRASPVGTTLVVEVHVIPTPDTAGTPLWYLKVDGAKATDTSGEDDQAHNVRCAVGAGTDLDDVFIVRKEYTVTVATKHTLELWTKDKCRVVGWFCHEKQRDTLTVGTDTMVDYTRLLTLSRIYDVDFAQLVTAVTAVYEKMKAIATSFNVDDPASPIAASSTSATKVYETAGVVGSLMPTQYRNRYMDQFAVTPSIPCYAWAYGERTAGANKVYLRLKGTNHPAGIDITINGAAGIYESTTFTLAPGAGGDTIIPEYLVEVAGTTGSIYAFGVLPLVGT